MFFRLSRRQINKYGTISNGEKEKKNNKRIKSILENYTFILFNNVICTIDNKSTM